jgi:NAD(P)-dependent dehydrogenase (short-subunit alcohol dehydrogenase family)
MTPSTTPSSSRIALITGSSRGLGKNMALALAAAGQDIVVTYRNNSDAADATVAKIKAQGRKAIALQIDTGVIAEFPSFAKRLDAALQENWARTSFDCLVNNAGMGSSSMIADTTEAEFDELMNVHFKGVYFLTQRLLPILADGGSIVNVSSGLTRFSFPSYASYACMKGAIEVFTRYLAKELGSRGINANTLAPGAIDTDFHEAESIEGLRQGMAAMTPLGRMGVPDDIGGVVAFLCSPAGHWMNGQRLEASGGIFV